MNYNHIKEKTDLEKKDEPITTTTTSTTTKIIKNSNTLKKPKVTYDDILKSLNLKVNNGILEYSLEPGPFINQGTNTNGNNLLKTDYIKKSTQNYNPIPTKIPDKNNYIYNKYFKDYKDQFSMEQNTNQPIYLSREELKKKIILEEIRKREERKRIGEIKSKKLLFARNNHFAPTNATPNHLNQLFLIRR
jgi:hypothetical protein